MDYQQTLEFLFTQFPMFQKVGQSAYKPGLDNAYALSELMGNPHLGLKTIHVAGTNGKGSTAHTLAAILQSAGYRTALFTSPHLVDFRERIRVNGEMISREEVVAFVQDYLSKGYDGHPSFFELTTIMAFDWFKKQNVDVAVIETGLGGRLDTTNIISPDLSIITNISFDHTSLLGDTLEQIAAEKAGIIKYATPVVIGESVATTRIIFEQKAEQEQAPIYFAQEMGLIAESKHSNDGWCYYGTPFGDVKGELAGDCQQYNAATVMASILELRKCGYTISDEVVKQGFANVTSLTGLMGRWMKVSDSPMVVCDTGHNLGGWQYIARQLSRFEGKKTLVLGFVNDKDIRGVLTVVRSVVDANTSVIFTKASVDRALPAEALAAVAEEVGLCGKVVQDVVGAYKTALAETDKDSMIFIGGSTFVVADFLSEIRG